MPSRQAGIQCGLVTRSSPDLSLGKKVALGVYSVPVEVGIGAKRAPGGTALSHPVSALRDSRRHSRPACGKAQFKGLRGSYAGLAMMFMGGRDTRRISQGRIAIVSRRLGDWAARPRVRQFVAGACNAAMCDFVRAGVGGLASPAHVESSRSCR